MTKIYLVENCFGDPNKVYIGKTISSRKHAHQKTYGKDIIYSYIDEIDSLHRKDWTPLEKFWIEYFKFLGFEVQNSNKKGGGGCEFKTDEQRIKASIPVIQFDLDGNFVKRWSSSFEIQKILGYKKSIINQCCSGIVQRSKGFIWMYENEKHLINNRVYNKSTSLFQYTLNGEFVKEWNSAVEAIEFLGYGNSNNINDCARGKYKSTYGFIWEYKKNLRTEEEREKFVKFIKNRSNLGRKVSNDVKEKIRKKRIGRNFYTENGLKRLSESRMKPVYQFNENHELTNIIKSFKCSDNSGIIGSKKLRSILDKFILYKGFYYSYNKKANLSKPTLIKQQRNYKKCYNLFINNIFVGKYYKLKDVMVKNKICMYIVDKCKQNNGVYKNYKIEECLIN